MKGETNSGFRTNPPEVSGLLPDQRAYGGP